MFKSERTVISEIKNPKFYVSANYTKGLNDKAEHKTMHYAIDHPSSAGIPDAYHGAYAAKQLKANPDHQKLTSQGYKIIHSHDIHASEDMDTVHKSALERHDHKESLKNMKPIQVKEDTLEEKIDPNDIQKDYITSSPKDNTSTAFSKGASHAYHGLGYRVGEGSSLDNNPYHKEKQPNHHKEWNRGYKEGLNESTEEKDVAPTTKTFTPFTKLNRLAQIKSKIIDEEIDKKRLDTVKKIRTNGKKGNKDIELDPKLKTPDPDSITS